MYTVNFRFALGDTVKTVFGLGVIVELSYSGLSGQKFRVRSIGNKHFCKWFYLPEIDKLLWFDKLYLFLNKKIF